VFFARICYPCIQSKSHLLASPFPINTPVTNRQLPSRLSHHIDNLIRFTHTQTKPNSTPHLSIVILARMDPCFSILLQIQLRQPLRSLREESRQKLYPLAIFPFSTHQTQTQTNPLWHHQEFRRRTHSIPSALRVASLLRQPCSVCPYAVCRWSIFDRASFGGRRTTDDVVLTPSTLPGHSANVPRQPGHMCTPMFSDSCQFIICTSTILPFIFGP
jgi:hypothetical protein